jgi:diacylglycerol kinase family enzyme
MILSPVCRLCGESAAGAGQRGAECHDLPGNGITGDDGGVGRLAVVVVNGARMRDLRRLKQACLQAASANGWAEPLLLPTSASDPGAGPAARALDLGAAMVVAVGGDGTVRACAHVLAGTDVPLAIVPAGAANLVARALGLPGRLEAAVAVAFGGRDRRIDVASAGDVTFAAMAGIGLDAAVVRATPAVAKRLVGWPAYAAAATSQLHGRPATLTLRIDGGAPVSRPARSVAVGNCGLLPGGFPIMPDARLDDGMLDVAILAPGGPSGWASIGYRVAVGSRHDDGQLVRLRARHVDIHADMDLPRQVDGEMQSAGNSLVVAVQPGALLVRVPT